MKVALVQQHVDMTRGGAETSTIEMARHLAAQGVDVSIICAAANEDPHVSHNVTFLPIAATGGPRGWQTYRFVREAGRRCRREGFHVVHAITPCLVADVYQPRGGTFPETVTRTLARVQSPVWRGIKRYARRFNISQRFLRRIEQTLLTKYRGRVRVAAVSEYVRRQVVDGFGFPEDRARVVFNGVDIEPVSGEARFSARRACRDRLGASDQTELILFVAHNFKLKGLAELLRALGGLIGGRGGRRLVIAGRDRRTRYQRLARAAGVADAVHFVGTDLPMRTWYAAADVLAHPTWYDPCSRVVLEALSVGLPVVTTRWNGACEVMEAGRHGFVINEPTDATGLREALTGALKPQVREACRADADRLHAELSMARHARALIGLYEDVVREKRDRLRSARAQHAADVVDELGQ